MNKPTRTYTLGTLAVVWRDGLCIHCGNCTAGLPEVFDPARPAREHKPWVDLSKASPDDIRSQVAACPSGALKIQVCEEGSQSR